MHHCRVKICGNRTPAEAQEAYTAGADAIGVLVGPHTENQKHFVDASTARSIMDSLPPFVTGVLVTTHDQVNDICALVEEVRPDALQCHTQLSMETYDTLRKRCLCTIIGVIHVQDERSIERASTVAHHVDALLLDTATPHATGGTGKTHDWSVSARIVSQVNVPVILAGGLTPKTVQDAIQSVAPYAVDVRSGVAQDGERRPELLQAFINNAQNI
jgi:phosphoribosylanthranilate isomerase